jgi:predicted phosphodiesterase
MIKKQIRLSLFSVLMLISSLFYAGESEVRFCVVGDSRGHDKGINSKVLKQLVIAIKKESPQFVLFVGDLANGYTRKKKLRRQLTYWRDTFMKPLIDVGIKVYPCRGNHGLVWRKHDLVKKGLGVNSKPYYSNKESLAIWNAVFSGEYQLPQNGPREEKGVTYSITTKNCLILCCDNYAPNNAHRVNQKWVDGELSKIKGVKQPYFLFILTHEPAYAVNHKDCLDDYPKERDVLIERFMNAGGDVIFCGHDHRYNHSVITLENKYKIHQYVVGTAGAPIRYWDGVYKNKQVKKVADFTGVGYVMVTINGNKCILTSKKLTAHSFKIIDTLTILKKTGLKKNKKNEKSGKNKNITQRRRE